jgi:hypothetical protein
MRIPSITNMKLGSGLLIGAAAVILVPIVLPAATGILKSLTKAGIKGWMLIYEKGKVTAAEARETIEDLAAEAREELAEAGETALVPKTKTAKVGAKA